MSETGRTTKEQTKVESKVNKYYSEINFNIQTKSYRNFVILETEAHSNFCNGALQKLPKGVSTLNSGQPWLLYWLFHSLDLMQEDIPEDQSRAAIEFIRQCKCPSSGAFCGGPYQMPHLAPTYASVATLLTLNTEEAFEVIDRRGVYNFILSMKRPTGGFRMHDQGESDMRSLYCAISVASVLNILDDAISENVGEYIARSQTYEGGIGGEPGGEAHGGYTYCGLASLCMLNKTHLVDLDRLLEWCTLRQMTVEGGFSGRTNKLVDSCYSFWVGACFPILKDIMNIDRRTPLYDHLALQAYVLVCCQDVMGFFDKPGSMPDYYHTAYSLAGVAHAQLELGEYQHVFEESPIELRENDWLFNVTRSKMVKARAYFKDKEFNL